MGLLETVASPITNLAGSIMNVIGQKKAQERENAQQKKMAEYAYSKDLEMWNRQNEYNNPQSQMNRFKEAGLNPALIYGKGSSGNATTMPKYAAPTLKEKTQLPDITGVIPAYQDYQLKRAQTDVATNQARLLDEKVTSESVNRALTAARKSFTYQQFMGLKRRRDWEDTPNAAQPYKSNLHLLLDTGANTKDQKLNLLKQQNTLAKYSWQIAEQNLKLREKDNAHYFWRNYGAGIGNVAGKVGRFATKGATKKLTSKLPKKLTPRGIRTNNSDILPNYNF